MRIHDCSFMIFFQRVFNIDHYIVDLVQNTVYVVRGTTAWVVGWSVDLWGIRNISSTVGVNHIWWRLSFKFQILVTRFFLNVFGASSESVWLPVLIHLLFLNFLNLLFFLDFFDFFYSFTFSFRQLLWFDRITLLGGSSWVFHIYLWTLLS